jgi:hypothetical protein
MTIISHHRDLIELGVTAKGIRLHYFAGLALASKRFSWAR